MVELKTRDTLEKEHPILFTYYDKFIKEFEGTPGTVIPTAFYAGWCAALKEIVDYGRIGGFYG